MELPLVKLPQVEVGLPLVEVELPLVELPWVEAGLPLIKVELPLVERAAIEEYERRRSVGPLDTEAERREALVHALAVHWKARLVASGTGGD